MDKELISGAMDQHAYRISVGFGEWLCKNYEACWPEFWIAREGPYYQINTSEAFLEYKEYLRKISNNNTLIP